MATHKIYSPFEFKVGKTEDLDPRY